MFRVGLTGGIGSGKSLVAKYFSTLGIPVIDADEISRELSKPGSPALTEIRAAFGNDVIQPDGTLDRQVLRERIFKDQDARTRLNAILHPRIHAALNAAARAQRGPYSLLVIPLLVENHLEDTVDRILVVDCPESLQIQRVMARDRISEKEARAILAAQASRQSRLQIAHDVIHNEGELSELEMQIGSLHSRYLKLAAGHDC
ncbi:MAG: dephospho-CoA kinase [Gammaproteobacteria bacterium]|jgi:dephospho-CoA kinase